MTQRHKGKNLEKTHRTKKVSKDGLFRREQRKPGGHDVIEEESFKKHRDAEEKS